MQHSNTSAWDALDQAAASMSPAMRAVVGSNPSFATHGSCLNYTSVHGYEPDDDLGMNIDTAYSKLAAPLLGPSNLRVRMQ